MYSFALLIAFLIYLACACLFIYAITRLVNSTRFRAWWMKISDRIDARTEAHSRK